jgi:drug/metabolite transporter (DMT)-like permease
LEHSGSGLFLSSWQGEIMPSVGTFKGVVLMTAANMAFCGMVCCIRSAVGVSAYTTTLFRFVVGLGLIGMLAMSGRIRLTFINKGGLFVRGFMGGLAVWMCFVAIVHLGMIKASLISNTYPVFATVFGILLLKERIGFLKIAALVGAFGGMAIVILGGGRGATIHSSFGIYEGIAVAGAMLGGLTVVLVKKLQETDSTESIFFAQCLVGFWIMVVPGGAASVHCGYSGCVMLLSIGLLASAGQLLSTEAYRFMPVSTASALTFLAPVFNCVAGVVLFHEKFSSTMLAGAGIMLGSAAIMILCDRR